MRIQEEALQAIARTPVCYLATCSEDGPNVVPVGFRWIDGESREGRIERVIVKGEPFHGDYNPRPVPGARFPQPVLQCEVEIISEGKREFAVLSELIAVA